MASLITGLDWIDHAMIPRRELCEPEDEEEGEGESPDKAGQKEEDAPTDERV